MKTKFIKLHNAIASWKSLAPDELNYDENDLIEWALGCLWDIDAYSLYQEKIKKIKFSDYKAIMPGDCKSILQVLYKSSPQCKLSVPELIEFSTKAYGEDCKWEYKKVCKCESACTCDSVIEIPGTFYMDKITELQGMKFGSVQYLNNITEISNNWTVLRPKTGLYDMSPDINVKTFTYDIDMNGDIITDMKEGELLVSYLGMVSDENGIPMIPDVESVIKAIKFYIEFHFAYIAYRKSRASNDFNFFQNAERLKNKYIGEARDKMNMPTNDEMYEIGKAFKSYLNTSSRLISSSNKHSFKNKFTQF